MFSDSIPVPPLELRMLVGPTDPADYDNPNGRPLLEQFGVAGDLHDAVFDFGCGCGRQARQLMLQDPRPRRYVGIDVHRRLVEWCQTHLTAADPAFRFVHHDVFSAWYAPDNALRLSLPFPVGDGEFSLILASSVFTHLTQDQADYYLREVARVLAPRGVAFTSWLFFDRAGFPFLPDVYSLYVRPIEFDLAVLFDREWFLDAVRRAGLRVVRTVPPGVPGHQWMVLLSKRQGAEVDAFPLGADGAEWVSGATLKAMAVPTAPAALNTAARPSGPPRLTGHLARLEETQSILDRVLRSKAWRVGRFVTAPVRAFRTRVFSAE